MRPFYSLASTPTLVVIAALGLWGPVASSRRIVVLAFERWFRVFLRILRFYNSGRSASRLLRFAWYLSRVFRALGATLPTCAPSALSDGRYYGVLFFHQRTLSFSRS